MRVVTLLTAVVLAVAAAGTALAQTPPGVDHYLVYKVLNPPTLTVPVNLSDQFVPNINTVTYSLDYFMTPVDKNNEGIPDPVTHYTWWRVVPATYTGNHVITNQFGAGQGFLVKNSAYLLNPALKGLTAPPTPPLPVKDHYVAYDAVAPPLGIPVTLVDQFGYLAAQVVQGVYVAPPAQKIYAGAIFPILDPVAHLVFYTISVLPPVAPPPPPVFATDEFGTWQLVLGDRVLLGVPSYKDSATPTTPSTWGRVKSLYR